MSDRSLFRPEVVENQRHRLWGEVIIVHPVRHAVLTTGIFIFTLSGLLYFSFGTYARTESVKGYVAPSGGLAQVYAMHGGTIVRVLAHEGDVVTDGQALVQLSGDTSTSSGPIGRRLREQTLSRIGEIETEIKANTAHYREMNTGIAAKISNIRAELVQINHRLQSEQEALALTEDAAKRVTSLEAAGYRTALEVNQRQQQVIAERASLQSLQQQQQQKLGELKDAQTQQADLPTGRDEKLAQLRAEKAETEQSLIQLDGNNDYVLTAPVAGRISALQAEPGQAVTPQMPLVALIPINANLEANLLTPSGAAGLIQPGQDVKVRIDAFPAQRFGTLAGHVAQISHSTYRPGELLAPIQFEGVVYKVVVALERNSVLAYGVERPLTPGMTLSADIVTDRRRFIDWVLDPIRAVQTRMD